MRFGIKLITFSLSSRLAFVLLLEIIASVIISLLALHFFWEIAEGVWTQQVNSFDKTLINFIYFFRNPTTTSLMLFFTFLASPLFVFIGSILMVLYLYIKRRKDALIFSAILYSGILVNLLLKDMFHRPRPTLHPLVHESTYSFPSGHAMNGFVFYAALTYFVLRETKNVKLATIFGLISAVVILCIGISRIYLGAHYPSDVVAGYIAGFIWFIAAIIFDKTIIFERLYRKTNYGKRKT